MVQKPDIQIAPKLLKCTNFGATFLYRRLVSEQGFDLPYSEIKCGDVIPFRMSRVFGSESFLQR